MFHFLRKIILYILGKGNDILSMLDVSLVNFKCKSGTDIILRRALPATQKESRIQKTVVRIKQHDLIVFNRMSLSDTDNAQGEKKARASSQSYDA